MLEVAVCIGSSCHLKGSRLVVEGLQNLIAEHKLGDKIKLCGRFCMGNCQHGVCVAVQGTVHSVKPSELESFFANEIATRV